MTISNGISGSVMRLKCKSTSKCLKGGKQSFQANFRAHGVLRETALHFIEYDQKDQIQDGTGITNPSLCTLRKYAILLSNNTPSSIPLGTSLASHLVIIIWANSPTSQDFLQRPGRTNKVFALQNKATYRDHPKYVRTFPIVHQITHAYAGKQ